MPSQQKPRKLPSDRITRWSRETQGNLVWIEAQVEEIVKVNDWIDDCRQGVRYDTVKRGGNDSTPTERGALKRPDDIAQTAAWFLKQLEEARKYAYRARIAGEKLIADWQAEDAPGSDKTRRDAAEGIARRANTSGTSSDQCSNCSRTVAGTANDRLRAGRCQECSRYKDRHNGNERPRELWDLGQCPATRWSAGVDFECALPMGHPQENEADHQWTALGEAVA